MIVENYKGVGISSEIVCYDIRYFVLDKHFTHFKTIEEAREDIDNTIFKGIAYEWISDNKDYVKGIKFEEDELIQIGRNIDSINNISTNC